MTASIDDLPQEIIDALSETADLEPIEPSVAQEQYLESRRGEVRDQTIEEYDHKLSIFVRFCEDNKIENLNEIDGRTLDEYKQYRRTETTPDSDPLAVKTMRDDMLLIRDFIEYLESIEGVPANLSEKVDVPKLNRGDGVRDISFDSERLESILDYLNKFEYASDAHVILVFYSHTGRRPGGLYALDLKDLHLNCEEPYIEFRHREGETELKNGPHGQNQVSISKPVADIFQDYIENHRHDVTDKFGRKPFLTSDSGRLSKSTMRKRVYGFTRPCVVSDKCPHDREPESCDAAQTFNAASNCPSSKPPYALRHGYITAKRTAGVPIKVVSGRCDVSEKVIEKHYDERDEDEKRELRQQILEQIQAENDIDGYY